MKIGSHCVLFGPEIASDLEGTLQKVAASGCAGVEIGARFFGMDRAAELKEALDRYGMKLAGLHALIPITGVVDNYSAVEEALLNNAAFCVQVGCGNLVTTGMCDMNAEDLGDARMGDPAFLKQAAAAIGRLAETVLERTGVVLNYHCHNWEFTGPRFFDMLLEASDHIRFGMDVGWFVVSGADPAALIRRYGQRFSYLHLRDYEAAGAAGARGFRDLHQGVFVNMGQGDMDMARILRAAEEANGDNCWGVVEYEFGEKDYLRYVKAVSYIRGMLDGLRA